MEYKVHYNDSLHEYMFNGKYVPSVTTILVDEGLIDTKFFTDEGRKRGKLVHKLIENHCKGAHCLHSEDLSPYLDAFKNFQRDCNWESSIIEQPFACEQYAGTPDQIGTLGGKPAIIDIKTGTISAATGLQLAAYEKLYAIYLKRTFGKADIGKIHRIAVQLTDTRRYILTEYKDRNDEYIWSSAVALWHWKKRKLTLKT